MKNLGKRLGKLDKELPPESETAGEQADNDNQRRNEDLHRLLGPERLAALGEAKRRIEASKTSHEK